MRSSLQSGAVALFAGAVLSQPALFTVLAAGNTGAMVQERCLFDCGDYLPLFPAVASAVAGFALSARSGYRAMAPCPTS